MGYFWYWLTIHLGEHFTSVILIGCAGVSMLIGIAELNKDALKATKRIVVSLLFVIVGCCWFHSSGVPPQQIPPPTPNRQVSTPMLFHLRPQRPATALLHFRRPEVDHRPPRPRLLSYWIRPYD